MYVIVNNFLNNLTSNIILIYGFSKIWIFIYEPNQDEKHPCI